MVIRDISVGRISAWGKGVGGTAILSVMRESRDEESSTVVAGRTLVDDAGKVAATGQGSKALGVGPEGGT